MPDPTTQNARKGLVPAWSDFPLSNIWPSNEIAGKWSHDSVVVINRNRKSRNRVLLSDGLKKV